MRAGLWQIDMVGGLGRPWMGWVLEMEINYDYSPSLIFLLKS